MWEGSKGLGDEYLCKVLNHDKMSELHHPALSGVFPSLNSPRSVHHRVSKPGVG